MKKLRDLKEVGIFLFKTVKSYGFKHVLSLVLFHTHFPALLIHRKGLILTLQIEGRCSVVYIFPTG